MPVRLIRVYPDFLRKSTTEIIFVKNAERSAENTDKRLGRYGKRGKKRNVVKIHKNHCNRSGKVIE